MSKSDLSHVGGGCKPAPSYFPCRKLLRFSKFWLICLFTNKVNFAIERSKEQRRCFNNGVKSYEYGYEQPIKAKSVAKCPCHCVAWHCLPAYHLYPMAPPSSAFRPTMLANFHWVPRSTYGVGSCNRADTYKIIIGVGKCKLLLDFI